MFFLVVIKNIMNLLKNYLNLKPMQLRKATRKKAKLRIGLAGPAGSGKTYSALLLASGMANWEKIAVIDTENGSGELYSHLGSYNVITLTAPFSPERYIEAITECEKAGMEVIIIDSTSHEWEGAGGCLESNEKLANVKFKGNTWAAWSVTTPRHQAFINKMLTSPCHIIATMRSKTDTIQQDGKVKKVGTKEIQREGTEYEFSVHFNIDRDTHLANVSKDRTELFEGKDAFVINALAGKALMEWANQGEEPTQIIEPPKPQNVQSPAPVGDNYTPSVQAKWSKADQKKLIESGKYKILKGPAPKEGQVQLYKLVAPTQEWCWLSDDIIAYLKDSKGSNDLYEEAKKIFLESPEAKANRNAYMTM